MRKLPAMINMARTPSEIKDASMPCAPIYPYGLSICFETEDLERLGVDYEDWKVDDTFHLFCLAKIKSISMNATTDGEKCRVEMCIEDIAGESEDEENEDEYEAE